jgi:hypothetical protein
MWMSMQADAVAATGYANVCNPWEYRQAKLLTRLSFSVSKLQLK